MVTPTRYESAARRIRTALIRHPELIQPRYRRAGNPLAGGCYIACEALRKLYPELRPACVNMGTENHWFLMTPQNRVVDVTSEQYGEQIPYETGSYRAFLPQTPSQRAMRLLGFLR